MAVCDASRLCLYRPSGQSWVGFGMRGKSVMLKLNVSISTHAGRISYDLPQAILMLVYIGLARVSAMQPFKDPGGYNESGKSR